MATAEVDGRMETASPILPGESAEEPTEMSKSQVASASPGKCSSNQLTPGLSETKVIGQLTFFLINLPLCYIPKDPMVGSGGERGGVQFIFESVILGG